MIKYHKSALIILLVFSANTQAALVERIGGLAFYDTETNLTWLTDANFAYTSGYDDDGLMDWEQANNWATNLVINEISGWRLPDTLQPDDSCSWQTASASYGYSCNGSELGNLFHNILDNFSYYDSDMNYQENWGLNNTGPFQNVQSRYWSSTEYAPYTENAWGFNMLTGYQVSALKTNNLNLYSWAVQTGDITAVPLPASAWLLLSGILALFGASNIKKS
ncbi:MAG: hypothetical protein OEZ38_09390 [Gammaproteobacteria bacterium]|nr:hypothetical protein [Gammaproteobacteria bacterium]